MFAHFLISLSVSLCINVNRKSSIHQFGGNKPIISSAVPKGATVRMSNPF